MRTDHGRDSAGQPANKKPTRSGFWGSGESGQGFADAKAQEHSREDYGATDHGGEPEPDQDDAGDRNPSPAATGESGSADQKPNRR